VALDVDLNNDGNFTDLGESGYASSTLQAGAATFQVSPALTPGHTYPMQARVTDEAGNQGTSATQNVQILSLPNWVVTSTPRTDDPLVGRAELQLGNVQVKQSLDLGLNHDPCTCMTSASIVYNSSRVSVEPIIQAQVTTANGGALPPSIGVQLTWDGVLQSAQPIYYSTTGLNPGDVVTVAAQVANPVTQTGQHSWNLLVRANYSTPIDTNLPGNSYIVVGDSSAFGAGWTFGGTDTLVPITGATPGILRVYGTTSHSFYQQATDNQNQTTYTSPQGDPGALVYNKSTSQYVYTQPDNTTRTFNSLGVETKHTSPDSLQSTNYSYVDAEGDGKADELSTVTTPDGAVTTFTYSSGKLSTINTSGGRAYTFTMDGSGDLTKIVRPDSSIYTLSYDTNKRLTQDQLPNHSTNYTYQYGMLSTLKDGSGGTTTVHPAGAVGMAGLVAGPVSAKVTERQFRRKYPGFQGFLARKRSAEISGRLPCDSESSEAQWAGRWRAPRSFHLWRISHASESCNRDSRVAAAARLRATHQVCRSLRRADAVAQ
jgi:hypothetical protein